jgi:hypothetical protein
MPMMIVQGQNFLKTIPSTGKQICLSSDLVDVIIHDLKERKYLIAKDSIYKGQISILKDSLYLSNNNALKVQKSLLTSEEKRKRNGWQRNSLLFMILIFGILCTK